MAATCEDGIGLIAAWTRKDEGWEVFVMDTEDANLSYQVDAESRLVIAVNENG